LDFEIHTIAVGEFAMPGLESLIDGDEVAFANRGLAIGVEGDVLEQRLALLPRP
jgi:hypothetical protein